MKLAQAELLTCLSEHRLIVALIGMSGVGKSHWSQKLAMEAGFTNFGCDDEIAKRISSLLSSEDVTGLAAWMGQLYTEGYREREKQYLALEEEVMQSALLHVRGNTVIDTTGSVIYLSVELLKSLKDNALVVYLEASAAHRDQLFQTYMADPKPVAWGKSFYKKEGESDHDALVRCFPELLEYRSQRYSQLADLTLSFMVSHDENIDGRQLLQMISEQLH